MSQAPHALLAPSSPRWHWLRLLLLPALLLLPCLVSVRTFLPYDLSQYPPASLSRTEQEVAAMKVESNYDVTETPVWFVPELRRAGKTLREEGALPNWNPTARTGTALLPHGHDAILYPYAWPALLLDDPAKWLAWLALLNLATAAFLMHGFLRALRLHEAAALLGAVAFSMSSTLAANAHNFPRLSSLVWLPGMLWALRVAHESLGRVRARALCGFAVAFALTWIGGFPPYALPCSAIAATYGIALLTTDARAAGIASVCRRAIQVGAAAALGVLLCSHYLLPAFAFFGESARSLAPDLERVSQSAFDLYGLLGWLAPDVFGRPDLAAALPYGNAPLPLMLGSRESLAGTPLLPNFNATEYALFSGSAVFWLAVIGMVGKRGSHRVLPLLLLLTCVGMALCIEPFWRLFALPGIRIVPPLRWLGPCAMLIAWLAAQGLDRVLMEGDRVRLGIAAACAAAFALVAAYLSQRFGTGDPFREWGLADQLAARYAASAPDPASITPERIDQLVLRGGKLDYAQNGARLAASSLGAAAIAHAIAAGCLLWLFACARRGGRWVTSASFALVVASGLDLWRADRTFASGIQGNGDSRSEAHAFLLAQRDAHEHQGGFMIARTAAWPDALHPVESACLPPGTLCPDGVRDLQTYTYFDARSIEPWSAMLEGTIGNGAGAATTGKGYLTAALPDHQATLTHPLLDASGVRYLCSTEPLLHAGPEPVHTTQTERGAFYVYERSSALPRAWCVATVAKLADDAAVVEKMVDSTWQPREVAFCVDSVATFPAHDPTAARRTARFSRNFANQVGIEVSDGPAATLVLADTFFSGWSARLRRDGNTTELPIHRVNHAMRGVVVPAGPSTVEFSYTPTRQRLGFALFALGFVALLVVVLRSRASRPAASRDETAG